MPLGLTLSELMQRAGGYEQLAALMENAYFWELWKRFGRDGGDARRLAAGLLRERL